jgi:hypothetical protein
MIRSLLLAALFFTPPQQTATKSPSPEETGIIAGTIVQSAQEAGRAPVQVILLSSQYVDLWNTDVQKRLDAYWERFKPAFAAQKELFFEVSRMAQKEATDYVVTRMRRDASVSDYLKQASPEGRFEFKNLPFGEYKVVALGKIGEEDAIWQESIDVRSPIPQFLELKKRLP